MRKILNEITEFLSNSVNRLTFSVWIIAILLVTLNLYIINVINSTKQEMRDSIKLVEKKVDYRYFNLTNSLEDIFKIRIDTYHGRIER